MKCNPIPLLLALMMSGSGVFSQVNTTDDYPNLPPGTPLSIQADGTASANGRINYGEDKDVLNFQVGNNGGVTIYTTGETDTNGVLKRQSSAGWSTIVSEEGGTGNFRISRVLDPGLYSIQVGGKLGANTPAGTVGGAYVLKVEIVPPTPPAPPDIDVPEVAIGGAISFGAVPVNSIATKTLTIRNTGASNLQVLGVTIAGQPNTPAGAGLLAGPFGVEGGGARTIAPGAQATVQILFHPSTASSFTATGVIASNDPDENPWTFTVTGTGNGPPPPPPGAPEIGLALGQTDIASGGTVDFGTINPASAGAVNMVVRELLISNTGDADLHLGDVKIIPPFNADGGVSPDVFRILTPPATVVAPGRSTVLRLGAGGNTTAPAGSVQVSALCTVGNDDADENPYRLVLKATLAAPPPPAAGEIAVFSGDAEIQDDGTLNLGTTHTGTPIERTVTIKNKGTGNLSLTSIKVEWNGPVIAIFPPPPPPFRVEGVEPRIVAPGASTTCRVIFPATASGPAESNLVIASSDADENPFTILLKAAAEGDVPPPAAPEIALSLGNQNLPMNSTVDFGRTSLTVPVKKTITISNQGTGVLQVRSVIQSTNKTPAGANAANGAILPVTSFRFVGEPISKVDPGTSRQLSIIFQPVANGNFTAALVISNNDSDENPYRLKLIGQGGTDPGAVPDIALSLGDASLPQGGTVNFGEVAPGVSVTKEIRIGNTGNGDLLLGRISFQNSTVGDPNTPGGVNAAGGGLDPANGNGGVVLPPVGALPFHVLPPPNNVVPAGGSAVLRVVYVAPPSGSHEAVLVIESNDPDESPYKLTLKGKSTGTAPSPADIAVRLGDAPLPIGGTLSFGNVVVGTPVRREITVSNTGGGELRILGFSILPVEFLENAALLWMPPNALVRVVSGPGVIPAGGSGKFVLEMMGFTPGPAKLQARISNNDPDENPYSFNITGEIQNPPPPNPGAPGNGGALAQ